MQDLITGVPGAGKSQRALWLALNDSRYTGRQIYYHNFGPLNTLDPRIADWKELEDFTQWHKLPAGCVLLVDECQSAGILPQRSATAAPPEHIEAFSKSRKLGIDVILVTQHAKNMDLFVRRLIETHEHLTRSGQFNYATVTEYQNYQDTDGTVDPATIRKKTRWLYDKSIWTLYKSSQQHTVKPRVHRTVYYMIAALIAVAVLVPTSIYMIKNLGAKKPVETANSTSGKSDGKSAPATEQQPDSLSRLSPTVRVERLMHDARDYAFSMVPLNPDYPESAPMFDEVRVVKTFPRIAGCAVYKGHCRCVDQQGTSLHVTATACVDYLSNGRFDPYRDERDRSGLDPDLLKVASTAKTENCATYTVFGIGGTPTTETRCVSNSPLSAPGLAAASPPSLSGAASPAGQPGGTGSPPTAAPDIERGGYVKR